MALNESVEGILSEVTEEEMGKLDRCEGIPAHYLRAIVVVKMKNGTEVDSVTYVANPSMVMDGLKPTKEYLSHLLAGRSFLSGRTFGGWKEPRPSTEPKVGASTHAQPLPPPPCSRPLASVCGP